MLREKIYEYYKNKEHKFSKQDEITFAPSYFTDCHRKVYYKKMCIESSNPITESALVKMDMGNAVHEKLYSILKELNIIQTGEELKETTYKGLKFFYKIDGIGKDLIVEVKSIYATGFKFVENQPKPEHILQLVLYMIFEKIDTGVLLYIGRDNGFMVEYVVKKNSGLWDTAVKKIELQIPKLIELKKKIECEQIPVRQHKIYLKNDNGIKEQFQKDKVMYKTDWQCSYCSWKNLCWKEAYDKIKDHQFYIDGKFI